MKSRRRRPQPQPLRQLQRLRLPVAGTEPSQGMSVTGEMTIENGSVRGMNVAVATDLARIAIDHLAGTNVAVATDLARNAIGRLAEMTPEKVATVAAGMMTSETPSVVGAEKKSAEIGVERMIVAVRLNERIDERRTKRDREVVPPRMARVLPSHFRRPKMAGEMIGGEMMIITGAVTIIVMNEGIETIETGAAEKMSGVAVGVKMNGAVVGAAAVLHQDLLGTMGQVALVLTDLRPLKAEGMTTTEAAVVVDTETIVIAETETETEIEIIGIGAGASYGELFMFHHIFYILQACYGYRFLRRLDDPISHELDTCYIYVVLPSVPMILATALSSS